MTRLIATANAQFYPTPLRVVAGLARNIQLTTPANKLHLLDPCAGRGTALALLRQLLCHEQKVNPANLVSYGIELDANRAASARTKLTHVLHTDNRTAKVSVNYFDLILHNPPYEGGGANKRLEHQFLKRVTPLLRAGGLLIHIVPQTSLAVSAEYLANHYSQIAVCKFPQPEFSQFRQVVLFGYKKSTPYEDKATAKQLKSLAANSPILPELAGVPTPSEFAQLLTANGFDFASLVTSEPELAKEARFLATGYLEAADCLEFEPDLLNYKLTANGSSQSVNFIFAAGEYAVAAAIAEATRAGVWANRLLQEQLVGSVKKLTGQRPLMPLRDGQAALLTSIGLLNNLSLRDETTGQSVLVKGRTYKEFYNREIKIDDQGYEISRLDREVLRTELQALDLQTGEVEVITPDCLNTFISRYRAAIQKSMLTNYPPLYVPRRFQPDPELRQIEAGLARLKRAPLGGQRLAIAGAALALRKRRGTIIIAEQGSGKTLQGAATAWLAGMRRVIVVCPSHLTHKWVREVELTIPGAKACVVKTVSDLEAAVRAIRAHEASFSSRGSLAANFGDKARPPFFIVVSKEMLKLDSRWQPAVVSKLPRPANCLRDENNRLLTRPQPHCPRCGNLVSSEADDEIALSRSALGLKKRRCQALRKTGRGKTVVCDEPLWQKVAKRQGLSPFLTPAEQANSKLYQGPRRIPLAHYIKDRLKGYFDLAILDEVHEYKAKGSAQGIATGILAGSCRRTLALSGTFAGGYSSTLFHLLYRFTDEIRQDYRYGDDMAWAWDYGIIERQIFREGDTNEVVADGAMSDRQEGRVLYREAPGLNPAVLLRLLGYTVFLKLTDVATALPPYSEHVIELPMQHSALFSQQESYRNLEQNLLATVKQQLAQGSSRLLGALVQTLLAWPDNPTIAESVIDKANGVEVANAPALPASYIYPKETKLLELYRTEKAAGRRMLIFIANTQKRDLAPRLQALLVKEAGARVAVLRGQQVAAEDRERWVDARLAEGVDVLICHPRLVQTGLDLLGFQTLVFYQIEHSVYVMRQASRRSWRIGQTQPIRVYHLAYERSAQSRALRHQAKKLQASNLLDGDLTSAGLVGLAEESTRGGEDNLMLELARALVTEANSSESEVEPESEATSGLSLEATLAQLRQQEIAGEALVLDTAAIAREELGAATDELFNALLAL